MYTQDYSIVCKDRLHEHHLRCDFDRPNKFAVRFSLVQFGSLWFNMASVDIKKIENKYDYNSIGEAAWCVHGSRVV